MDPTLDDTFEYLRAFGQALTEFNQELAASANDLHKSDEQIAALWQDEGSKPYQQQYEPLSESLDRYLRSDAPRFEHFIEMKIRQLSLYLHGS